MKYLRIGQRAARSGVSAKALRLYEARDSMDLGIPAADPAVQSLGRRRHALVNAFTRGNAKVARRLKLSAG